MTLHEEEGLFAINPLSIMPYEKKDSVWVSVTIERDLHLTELQRTTYNFFDFVSDLGGLSGFLFPFFAVVVNIWSFNSFDNTMVSKLFRIQTKQPPQEKVVDSQSLSETTEPIVLDQRPNCCDFLRSFCGCMFCCKRSRQSRVLLKARHQLNQEIDVYFIVRLHRFLYAAVVDLLSED